MWAPTGSVTTSDARACQSSASPSEWMILGQVRETRQRRSSPSVRPLSGSVSVVYVNGNWSPG